MRASRISPESTKEDIRAVVDGYFRTDRPILLQEFVDEELFEQIDEHMQDLLRHTHRRTAKARYIGTIDSLTQAWQELEVTGIRSSSTLAGGDAPEPNVTEQVVYDTLKRLCPAAASCYWQALTDLAVQDRFSWRGTATEVRETLREVLDKLAPDDDVTAQPGYKNEPDTHGPTMKQRVRFILKSRKIRGSSKHPAEEAAELVEEKFGSLVRTIYSRSSGSVHSGATRKDIVSLKRFVETVLVELLELSV